MLAQARELYSGHPHLRMDAARLLAGGNLCKGRSPDVPDFRSQMAALLQPLELRVSATAPISITEIERLIRRGSAATSLDELPRSLLEHLPGHGINALQHVINSIAAGAQSELLNAVLHLPLRKKEPAWLLRNSRPVLLEPFVRRLEATAIFKRLQHQLEQDGSIPSCMFAYRRQIPPQHAGLTARWLIGIWASNGDDVCIADWDESNAFCNISHEDAPAVLNPLHPELGEWMQQFYGALQVHVITPFGLTPPYRIAHGGGQGDSGGVGTYLAISIQRTRFNNGTLLHTLQPRDLAPGAPSPEAICPGLTRSPCHFFA